MPRIVIQVYICTDTRCRNVEEYQELCPHVRSCSKCGKTLKAAGKREVEDR